MILNAAQLRRAALKGAADYIEGSTHATRAYSAPEQFDKDFGGEL
ncbi:hypothetical protein VRRI112168_10785 [Vreelandella rituensis]|nr:hypothetical protein [Halomonas rituensis]